VPGLSLLQLRVLSLQAVLEHVSEELQSDVFERECRSMPQLENKLSIADLLQRRSVLMSESSVGAVDDVFKVLRWDTGRRDEEGENPERKVREGET